MGEVGSSALASRLTAAAALLLGIATMTLFGSLPNLGTRFLLIFVVFVLGVAVFSTADRAFSRFAYAVGPATARGIGGAAMFLAAYLSGPLLIDLTARAQPPAAVLIALTFLPSFVVLLGLAAKGVRAGAVGAGMVVPTATVMLLAQAEIDQATTALALLGMSMVATVVAVWSVGSLSTAGIVAGAVSTSIAVGTGALPLNTLTESPALSTAALSPTMQIVVAVLGPILATLLGGLALLRRDAAGGVLAGVVLVTPLMIMPTNPSATTAGTVAPLAVAIGCAAALLIPGVRAASDRAMSALRPGGATPAGTLPAVAGISAIVFAARPLPLIVPDGRLQGLIALLLLGFAAVLAWRLPGRPGATLAGVTLVGLALATPWRRLVIGEYDPDAFIRLQLSTLVAVIAAVGLSWALVRRHRRTGVAVAAAYLLAGTLADLTRTVVRTTASDDIDIESAAVLVWVLPLLVLGLPAAVAALTARAGETRAAGQAIAALTIAMGGFTLLKLLLRADFGRGPTEAMAVLTPTDVGLAMLGVTGPLIVISIAALLIVAVLVTLSAAQRANAAVVAAVLLIVVSGMQLVLIIALNEGGTHVFDLIQWTVLAVSAAVTLAAIVAVRSARGPLDAPVPSGRAGRGPTPRRTPPGVGRT
jgi:hypothetical protein